ncbi:MAG: EamA family transporter [Candidatus Parcubacteria bacterium]|nr:EamA family transporter [Candidatus Parcubacteria bacterium]
MIWFLYSILCALFESLKDVAGKKSLKNIDEYVVAWSLRFFALPILIPFLLFIKIPPLGEQFWIALLVSGSLNIVATILFFKALKSSDLSIVIPMVTFTPIFLLITSPLLVHELPNALGIAGIILGVIGAYIMKIKEISKGYLAPFKSLLKEKGPKLMLLVAFIWSITSNFDKIGVQNSSPIFWVISINFMLILGMLPIMLYKSQKPTTQIMRGKKILLLMGLFSAISVIFQMTAINLTLVAYVISIKRTSVVMGVIFGALIFKEKGIKERLIGAVIMVISVLIIGLS